MSALIDLAGHRFGRLVVVQRVATTIKTFWECVCDCGEVTVVWAANLRNGNTVSCGCARGREPRHGHAIREMKTPEYRAWKALRQRCNNPRDAAYEDYGGRGIRVCERWEVFENFLADMGRKPSPIHSIDRFPDNDGNYEPGNCRWATPKEQANNTRPRSVWRAARTRINNATAQQETT